MARANTGAPATPRACRQRNAISISIEAANRQLKQTAT